MEKSTAQPLKRLAHQTSPYLRQHAHNPVDWYPWGDEALERAQREGKPILLSIGYAACHWCHVMAHESFEDEATAATMNQLYISVKVDREERPDLDRLYQISQQMLTGRGGGWPLTMFLTHDDQRPFFGGTYFPREARFGLP
ncbi:MAG TPA: thioredoxin domain-containing protein, partial [Steroidobacteraceae bacterium]